jgi:hypothetical protein
MPWNDAADIAAKLTDALRRFDWSEAETLVFGVISRRRLEGAPFPETEARRMLRELRGKRRFQLMDKLAESFQLGGLRTPQIRRQLAQSLIEQARYEAAEQALDSLITELTQAGAPTNELTEARGLMGRLFKQLYINPLDARPKGGDGYLPLALQAYSQAYAGDPRANFWPGINLCALLAWAGRHNVTVSGYPAANALARDVLTALEQLELDAVSAPPAWQIASTMESLIALNRAAEAFQRAREYVQSKDADAFELGSTLRQLTEVWELPAGNGIVTLLRAMLLHQEGGDVTFPTTNLREEQNAIAALTADASLQAALGDDRFKTLGWYKLGLTRADSVGRIETKSTQSPFGTGWLVKARDFNPNWPDEILLVTNKHVISPRVNGQRYQAPLAQAPSLLPEEAIVNLQQFNVRLDIEPKEVWTSPDTDLDATFVRMKGLPEKALPLEIDTIAVTINRPPDRVYIMGHPAGMDLQISLQDNLMIDCNPGFIQYRAPTLGGSSGSPVFDAKNWRVIALHHGGGKQWRKLDGSGKHEANEGIAIFALIAATQST